VPSERGLRPLSKLFPPPFVKEGVLGGGFYKGGGFINPRQGMRFKIMFGIVSLDP
jgi:hypothetical protein